MGHAAKDCWHKDAGGKGKTKGSTKGSKGAGKSSTEKFAGKCNYCQKTGHKENDCRKKAADKTSGKRDTNAISQESAGEPKTSAAIERYDDDDEQPEGDFFCMCCTRQAEPEAG